MDTSPDDLYEFIQASLMQTGLLYHSMEKLKEIYQLLYTKTMTLSTMFKQQ
jgi:hypothetical protein